MWRLGEKNWDNLRPAFERVNEKFKELAAKRPLSFSALQRIREEFSVEWTYNSNSIEGNTLTLNETRMVIKDGLTVGGKTMREHFEAINHEKAIEYLYGLVDQNPSISGSDILSMHAIILRNIDDDFAGRIRNSMVRITGANFTPPAPHKISGLLDELLEYVQTNPDGLNDIEMAAVFHHRLVWIHPFFDGNGRTARLAMSLFLMRRKYPPAIILKIDRNKYYDALNRANKGDYRKMVLLVLQALERSLNLYLNASSDYTIYEDIQTIVEDPAVPYGAEYISLLARRGKIDAYKEGKNWVTSRSAVESYMQNRKTGGRPKK